MRPCTTLVTPGQGLEASRAEREGESAHVGSLGTEPWRLLMFFDGTGLGAWKKASAVLWSIQKESREETGFQEQF